MVAKRIKVYLIDRGIKQSWLADKLGIFPSRLSAILSGDAPLSAEMLYEICSILQIDSSTFEADKTD